MERRDRWRLEIRKCKMGAKGGQAAGTVCEPQEDTELSAPKTNFPSVPRVNYRHAAFLNKAAGSPLGPAATSSLSVTADSGPKAPPRPLQRHHGALEALAV